MTNTETLRRYRALYPKLGHAAACIQIANISQRMPKDVAKVVRGAV